MKEKDIFSLLNQLDTSWHSIIGICGNYYIGHLESELMLSILTYKRFCDRVKEMALDIGFAPEGLTDETYASLYKGDMIPYDYRQISRWDYVVIQKDQLNAFQNAIHCINRLNFMNIPYGDKIIPEFYCGEDDKKYISAVLRSWMKAIDSCDLSRKSLTDENWLFISKRIRQKIIQ